MAFEITRSEHVFNGAPITWLTADDTSALGMEKCGCGQRGYRIVRQHDGVVSVAWWHPDGVTCRMAFDGVSFRPLTFEEYLAALGQEAEEEA